MKTEKSFGEVSSVDLSAVSNLEINENKKNNTNNQDGSLQKLLTFRSTWAP